MRKQRAKISLLGLVVLLCVGLFGVTAKTAYATNPNLINFQGKVVNADGTNVSNGTYNFDFVMYDSSTLGSPSDGVHDKWHELTKSVTVTNGVFQTNLGSATTLPDFNANPSLYLAIRFNADAAGYMTPRIQMTSVPYALNSDNLGGLGSSAFGQLAANQTWTGTNTIQPTTNITGLVVKQTSFGSPTADIFNVQTANSSSVIQVTGPSANNAAVSITSVGGSSGLTLQSGSGTISLGSTTAVAANGALSISTGGTTQTLTLTTPASTSAATGAITIQSGNATVGSNLNAGTVTIDTGTRTGVGTASINVGTTNAAALGIGNGTSTTTLTLEAGTAATAIQIGNGTTAHGIQIGSNATSDNDILIGGANSASTFSLEAGTAATAIQIGNGNTAHGIQIGTNSGSAQTIVIGSTNASSLLTLQGGTTASTAVTIGTNGAGGITIDSGTTGSILIGGGTSGNPAKTISIGPTATNTSTTTYNFGVNTAGTQLVNLGSAGSGNATAGTLINIQGGTTASTAIKLGTNGAGGITIDSGTTGSILIGGGTSGNPAKTISIGPTATNSSTTTYNFGVNTAGTQLINLGSAGSGNAAAGTLVNIQGGTTASTAVTIGTNGAGGITMDSGTTGSILIGAGTGNNAKTITIGPTATKTSTTTINIGTNTAGGELLSIGSNNASSTFTADSGTGAVTLFNSNTAHTIQIANGGAAAGNAQVITIGSPTTTTNSKVILTGGNIGTSTAVGGVHVGSDVTDANLVELQVDSYNAYADIASTCTATVNQGAIFYNSVSASFRACINGAWEDMASTAALGVITFGVVPDSTPNLGSTGDLAGVGASGANGSGPCKVYLGSAITTIRWTSCIAYSGGRKVVVAAQTSDLTVPTGTGFVHVCLNTANTNQPVFNPAATPAAETANLPTFSANSPILCIADVSITSNNVVGIYDTRTFTTSIHTFANVSSTTNLGLGAPVTTSGTNIIATAASATNNIAGILAAWGGATSGTPNSIISVGGPVWAKATAGTAGAVVTPSATAGRVVTGGAPAGPYGDLGLMRSATWSATCTAGTASTCQLSIFFDFFPR